MNLKQSEFQNRWDFINRLVSLTHMKRYLEIGVCGHDIDGNNMQGINWNNVLALAKDGVDPCGYPANHIMSSDTFFKLYAPGREWDVIFIDGDHEYGQVKRDLENALKHLAPGGYILMHDICPLPKIVAEIGNMMGIWTHIWCAIADFSLTRTDLSFKMIDIEDSNIEANMAIIRPVPEGTRPIPKTDYKPGEEVVWDDVLKYRDDIFDEVLTADDFDEQYR